MMGGKKCSVIHYTNPLLRRGHTQTHTHTPLERRVREACSRSKVHAHSTAREQK